jgi:hypothetical protein
VTGEELHVGIVSVKINKVKNGSGESGRCEIVSPQRAEFGWKPLILLACRFSTIELIPDAGQL